MRLLCVLLLFLLLTACAEKKSALTFVGYSGDFSIRSNFSAQINLKQGIVTFDPYYYRAGTTVQNSSKVDSKLHFNLEDQKVFVDSLKAELNRLKTLNVVDGNIIKNSDSDANIQVWFTQTNYNPSYNMYRLEVTLTITSGEEIFEKNYLIVSSKGDSVWQRLNTSAMEGKMKAGQKLMDKIIPDIGNWLEKRG